MSSTSIAQTTDNPANLIQKWATPTVTIPAWRTNSGLTNGRKSPIVQGERYAVIVQQEPGNAAIEDHLYATRLDGMENFALEERVPGFQWGPSDEDNFGEFVFTIVGIYTVDRETPGEGGWTDVHLAIVAEAVAA